MSCLTCKLHISKTMKWWVSCMVVDTSTLNTHSHSFPISETHLSWAIITPQKWSFLAILDKVLVLQNIRMSSRSQCKSWSTNSPQPKTQSELLSILRVFGDMTWWSCSKSPFLALFGLFYSILTNFIKSYLQIHGESKEVHFEFWVGDCKYSSFYIGTLNSLCSFGDL